MKPELHAQILTLRKYQAWRTGEDGRTAGEAGIVPSAVTIALDAVLEVAESCLRDATKPAEPSGYAYRYRDGAGGTVLRFNSGEEVNGARPVEAVPFWFAPPNATTVTCQLYGHPLHVCAECNHELAVPSSVPTDEEIDAVFNAMPNGVQGWLVDWGYRQFARALLAKYGREADRAALPSQDREGVFDKAKHALMIAHAHAPCPLYAEAIEAIDNALLAKYGHNNICCKNPSQCWEPCGDLGNSAEHAAVAPNGVNSIPPLDDESDALTVAYISGLEDGKKINRTDAAHYRFLRSMPMGIKMLTQIGPGEWEEILSGDELDTFLKEYPR